MTHYTIRARSDGRAGMSMFGLPKKDAMKVAGETVYIGDHTVTVGTDGRINVPRDIMDTYGVTGDDGRKRLNISFASDSEGNLGVLAYTTGESQKNAVTGTRARKQTDIRDYLEPEEVQDFNWSPV